MTFEDLRGSKKSARVSRTFEDSFSQRMSGPRSEFPRLDFRGLSRKGILAQISLFGKFILMSNCNCNYWIKITEFDI